MVCSECKQEDCVQKTHAELTDYKNIYNTVYWGGCRACTSQNRISFEETACIIAKRNELVRRYGIRSIYKPKGTVGTFIHNNFISDKFYKIDHVEFYKTHTGIIILSSPYVPSVDDIKKYIQKGWVQIDNLYGRHAQTFMISFVL
jgi:hypothetical protein